MRSPEARFNSIPRRILIAADSVSTAGTSAWEEKPHKAKQLGRPTHLTLTIAGGEGDVGN